MNTPHFFTALTVCQGRPKDQKGRLSKELKTYDKLDQLGINYQRLDHPPAASVEDCNEVDTLLGITICKNLFLCNAQKTAFYLLMMPGHKKFKTAFITKQLGCSRLSFAKQTDMEKLLNISPGSVSVLGLMNDTTQQVQLLIDAEVITGQDYIGCHPCINTTSLKIKTSDLLTVFLPAIAHPYTLVNLPD